MKDDPGTRTRIERQGGRSDDGGALRQPNDRDESATDAARVDELAPVQREQMRRAARDERSPARDTDCRSTPSASPDCAQPRDPDLFDDVLAPDDPQARDAENRRGATHDPGEPATGPAPDGPDPDRA